MPHRDDELIPTRASLLNRLKDWQDQSSWQEFFDLYWKLIYGVARKAGMTDGEAQDVVQDTMVSVARHMPTFKYDPAIGSFRAWLLTMLRWRMLDRFRKRQLAAADSLAPGGDGSHTDPVEKIADPASLVPDATWEVEWEKNLLEAALNNVKRRLDPLKYQIFDCYVNKEWEAEKVAARFGVSVNQVYMIKHRVTQTIREEVSRLEKEMA